ncbi:MAG: hypothetical protein ACR2F1_07895 [Nitrososphaeraceae archaeon]
MSEYILKVDIQKDEKKRKMLEQLIESTKNFSDELNNQEGFSIYRLAEQEHIIKKYVNVLKKEFRI